MTATGYQHAAYAAALSEFGTPLCLQRSGGWLLARAVPGTLDTDAMWCYPLFCCRDWSQLQSDIDERCRHLVSIALVADPFGGFDRDLLVRTFPDRMVPFKEHYVADLREWSAAAIHPHHRRHIRKAAAAVDVDVCGSPQSYLEDWMALYSVLVARHGIRGIAAFSPESFRRQLDVPGLIALRAADHDTTVGMALFFVQNDVAYYHLGAYNARGYEVSAAYAIFARAIEHLSTLGLAYLNLGAGAGADGAHAQESGLSRFKAGWSTGTRTAYFCGRVVDRSRYEALAAASGTEQSPFFPSYRTGEFSARRQ